MRTKYIYKTETVKVTVLKTVAIDSSLTQPLPVPYWDNPSPPAYLDLKKLYLTAKATVKQCNSLLIEINEVQDKVID